MNARPEPARILVIDNDDDLVRALVRRLEHAGYACMTASSGSQAMSIFKEAAPDLVITDLNMPHGDGIALVRDVRERSDVPVIVITGFSGEFRDELRTMRDVTCLRKPFDTDALLDLIETELMLSPARS